MGAHGAVGASDHAPKAQSLQRRERLRKRSDFLSVQERGRRVHGHNYLVLVLPRPPGAEAPDLRRPRFGVTVSKKVGGAVARNRVKRWLREAYRRRERRTGAPIDLVVVARPQASQAGYAATADELRRLLDRARL